MSKQQNAKGSRWFPSPAQLKDPSSVERSFRQVLTQLYSLQDAHDALKAQVAAGKPASTPAGPPPGSGPTDSMLLGLHVAPVDTTVLSNGASLKFNKANGNFEFS